MQMLLHACSTKYLDQGLSLKKSLFLDLFWPNRSRLKAYFIISQS